MSLRDPGLLTVLYHELATPPLSPSIPNRHYPHSAIQLPRTTSGSIPTTPINLSPKTPYLPPVDHTQLPIGSLLPNKLPPPLRATVSTPDVSTILRNPCPAHLIHDTDSLTREKKGKMPALSHLLSVGKGRVLALAADEQYVYAGCQSANNEIVVSLAVIRVGRLAS